MKIRDFCVCTVCTVAPQASLREAALLMRKGHVGALVAADPEGRPVGVITDRDIVIALAAVPGARLEELRVDEVMSSRPAVIREDAGMFEAAQVMSERAIRRLPVVSPEGKLCGIVTADDLHRVMATGMATLAAAMKDGVRREALEERLGIMLRRMPAP